MVRLKFMFRCMFLCMMLVLFRNCSGVWIWMFVFFMLVLVVRLVRVWKVVMNLGW